MSAHVRSRLFVFAVVLGLVSAAGVLPSADVSGYGLAASARIAYGTGEGELGVRAVPGQERTGPESFAVDPAGHVLVCDTLNHRVQVFTRTGEHVRSIDLGPEVTPSDLAVTGDGDLVVYDDVEGRLHHLGPEGARLGSVSIGPRPWTARLALHVVGDRVLMGTADQSDVLLAAFRDRALVAAEPGRERTSRGIATRGGSRYLLERLDRTAALVHRLGEGGGTVVATARLSGLGLLSLALLDEDRQGRAYVQVEVDGPDGRPRLEVYRLDPEGPTRLLRLPRSDYAVWTSRLLQVDSEGSVVQLLPARAEALLSVFSAGGGAAVEEVRVEGASGGPQAAGESEPADGWSGDTWGDISRPTIVALAATMMDSTWSPAADIHNFGYGSTYHDFSAGTTYTGEAYSQNNPQESWSEFAALVASTAGGTTGYGNDCSGFASIAWKLPSRYTTTTFESDATSTGGYVDSLGAIGSAGTVTLYRGDAINEAANHIILFDAAVTSGMTSMEQTPWTARRRTWTWSSLSTYRPIRRKQVIEHDLRLGAATGVLPSPMVQGQPVTVTATLTNTGTAPFAGETLAALYDASGTYVTDIDVKSGVSLAAGGSQVLAFTRSQVTSDPGSYQVWILARPTGGKWTLVGAGSHANPLPVEIASSCTVDPGEPNESFAAAFGVGCGVTEAARICSPTDVDYYRLVPSRGGTATVTMTPPADEDYELTVFGSDQAQLCSSTNPTGAAESCEVGVTAGAPFYVKVHGYSSAWSALSTYSLLVSCPAPVAADDLDGDGRTDLLWRKGSSGEDAAWLMNGATVLASASLPGVGGTWAVAGGGDLDGDGKADVVWRDAASGSNALWLMDGTAVASSALLPAVDGAWTLGAVGDLDGDGRADLFWRQASSGATAAWLMNGPAVASSALGPTVGPGWQVAGSGDLDGDGRTDLFWREAASGATAVWLMNGAQVTGAALAATVPAAWAVAGTGDLDGDSRADVVWRNAGTGENAVWFMAGVTVASGAGLPAVAAPWGVAGIGDLDGDGRADLVWRQATTGENAVWFMDGATVASGAGLVPVADPGWGLALP